MIQIYTASAGSAISGPAGWAFIVAEEVKVTGTAVIHYSGYTDATHETGLAMAILQALYWIRENKITLYQIFAEQPGVAEFNPILNRRIAAMYPKEGAIIRLETEDVHSEWCKSLAEKARLRIINEPQATFDSVDIGNNLVKKEKLFSQSYVVMGKFLSSRTLALQNLTTVSKRTEVWSKTDFDKSNFINL